MYNYLVLVTLMSITFNIPLGFLRNKTRKFSIRWFILIHLTVPLIYYFRTTLVMPKWSAVIFIVAAIFGQLAGSRIYTSNQARKEQKPLSKCA